MKPVTFIKQISLIGAAVLCVVACNTAPPPQAVTEVQPAAAPISKATSVARRKAGNTPGAVVSQKTLAAVNELEVPQEAGKNFKFADLKGKVVLVDIWATYCPPCREQAPRLAALSKKYRAQGLAIVGLNIDEAGDRELVKAFMKQAGINYPVIYANDSMQRAFLDGTEDETGAAPIPQLFLVARDGKVVEHLIGNDPRHSIAQLEAAITKELN